MSELTVITNNVPRDVLEAYELDEKEREDFDYLDWEKIYRGEDSASFFHYKGMTYDLGEFERVPDSWFFGNMQGWDGYQSNSFFSGILVKYVDNGERVVVGRFFS